MKKVFCDGCDIAIATHKDASGDRNLCQDCHEDETYLAAIGDEEREREAAFDDLCYEMDEHPEKFRCVRCWFSLNSRDWLNYQELCTCGNCGASYTFGEVEEMAVPPI